MSCLLVEKESLATQLQIVVCEVQINLFKDHLENFINKFYLSY